MLFMIVQESKFNLPMMYKRQIYEWLQHTSTYFYLYNKYFVILTEKFTFRHLCNK